MRFFAFASLFLAGTALAGTEKALEIAALKEGALQVSSNKLIYSELLLEAFAKRFPGIKIRHDRFDAGSQTGYDSFESNDPAERTDVMLRCQDLDLLRWVKLGWLAPLDDLPNWKLRPRHLEDDKRYVYFVGSPHVVAYNPAQVQESELPRTYQDLLDPKWKRTITMRNPLAGNSPAFFVQYMGKSKEGLGWFSKLGKNAPFIASTGQAVHQAVQSGASKLALSRDLEVLTFNKSQGGTLKYKFLEGRLPYQYQLFLVSQRAPHKAAARLFANWLLSPEAQAVLEKAGISVGERQKAELEKPSTWQWEMLTNGDYDRYRGTLFEAQRNLRSAGSLMQERNTLFREANTAVANTPGD